MITQILRFQSGRFGLASDQTSSIVISFKISGVRSKKRYRENKWAVFIHDANHQARIVIAGVLPLFAISDT
jgi:hypothetical protein